ncbi:hypothetical protein RFI_35877 [Reticulomyxa filosa]|uniref:Uncharacterized protein n=1 Tax=Reticulomyxa filosa TaxID=46433 RepID=X6LHX9_RETFI|nr:hypothetical protein RFI_35877 [Reticulomyxa filosa]|eukprot:ETO01563.1 hypothetical protein RFI_35877 [Reticulomyxa filosa]
MEDESIYKEKEKEETKETSTELSHNLKEEKNIENKHWVKQTNQNVMKQMWKEKRRCYGDHNLFHGDSQQNNCDNGVKGKMSIYHYDNIIINANVTTANWREQMYRQHWLIAIGRKKTLEFDMIFDLNETT